MTSKLTIAQIMPTLKYNDDLVFLTIKVEEVLAVDCGFSERLLMLGKTISLHIEIKPLVIIFYHNNYKLKNLNEVEFPQKVKNRHSGS
jgi:hypothetical protein